MYCHVIWNVRAIYKFYIHFIAQHMCTGRKKVKNMTSLKHLSMHYVFNFVKQTLGHVLNCCVKGIFQTF